MKALGSVRFVMRKAHVPERVSSVEVCILLYYLYWHNNIVLSLVLLSSQEELQDPTNQLKFHD